ncbi:MAG: DUF3817 domain-containing protein [Bacteroidota bacterium]
MLKLFNSHIGRLRVIAILEGISLLILVFVSVPIKRIYGITELSNVLGPVHGVLFLLFVFNTITTGIEYKWQFKRTTWKVLLACIIPFGTFYIDHKILKPIYELEPK